MTEALSYPVRINKYLASKNYCTRREADELITAGKVKINGKKAALGDKVLESDKVEVLFRAKKYRYFAYYKPRGIISHSPQQGEKEIANVSGIKDVFPVGRLDKDSSGLIILTDDGRITDKMLNPEFDHEKEYMVTTKEPLQENFARRMERGVFIEGYTTKPCKVHMIAERKFSVIITEGKKHQIRRMCAALGYVVDTLERRRIMNITLGKLGLGQSRAITGVELSTLLRSLGL